MVNLTFDAVRCVFLVGLGVPLLLAWFLLVWVVDGFYSACETLWPERMG